jgi:small neutral amino acid transporter SnatA (MarC family)
MIWSDLAQLIGAILLMIGAVLPVVNPLGDALIFLRMTPGCDAPNHGASRETHRFLFVHFIAGADVAWLLGPAFVRPFDPHWASRGVAVVCVLGWKHLAAETPKPADVTPVLIFAKAIALGRAFAPLTMPLTIDAGVVSAAFTVGAKHARTLKLVVGVSPRSSCCASVTVIRLKGVEYQLVA